MINFWKSYFLLEINFWKSDIYAMDSHQLPSHSSAISSYVFNVAPKILGMQGPVVFVDIRYGSVGLQNRKHSSYGYCRYARRTGTPGAAQGIDFIQLLPDCIPEYSITDSVNERYPHSPVLHILVNNALEILQLI